MAYTTMDDPTAHFNTSIWTGNGIAGREIIGVGFQPDFIWAKRRDDAGGHNIFDSTRGATKRLEAHGAGVEADDEAVSAFNSDGFTMNTTTTGVNIVKATYAAWSWKANGGTRVTFTESGDNPAGGYQANTTAGFSIVDYVGTGGAGTVAHGLGVAPYFIIIKARDGTDANEHWRVGHNSMAWTHRMQLNETEAKTDSDTCFNDTAPTSSVFTIGTDNKINTNDENMIAYVWAPIQGYSKFGSYTGNGNADGPFVYTGFKPAFVMLKSSSTASTNWPIFDSARGPFNVINEWDIVANDTSAESSADSIDFLSNGFKLRRTGNDANGDGLTYVYAAFAAAPFVTSNGAPTNAQ